MRIRISVYARNPVHTRLNVWVNGGLITSPGAICLRNDEVAEFVQRLLPDMEDDVGYQLDNGLKCSWGWAEPGEKEVF